MEASHAPGTSGYVDSSRLSPGEFFGMGAALVLLGSLWLPWFTTSETNPNSELAGASGGDGASAWQVFSTLDLLLVAAAGAPFILQGRYELSPQQFGLAFSANAVGMIIMTQLNPILVGRHGPVRVMSVGVLIAATGAAALLTTALTGFGGMLGFLVPLGVILGAAGICFPNAPAIALSRHGEVAGTAPIPNTAVAGDEAEATLAAGVVPRTPERGF